jgi:hypothetical protein
MAITRLTKHDQHEISMHLTRNGRHYAALRCRTCDQHIQWLSEEDATKLQLMGVPTMTNKRNKK